MRSIPFEMLNHKLNMTQGLSNLLFKRRDDQNIIVNGQKLAKSIMKNLQINIQQSQEQFQVRAPKLAIILVGKNQASLSYVKKKIQACQMVGINHELYHFGDNVEQKELEQLIKYLNQHDEVDSILTQLPLPNHINKQVIINSISTEKDVDCLRQISNLQNMVFEFKKNRLQPCTPSAIMHVLDHYKVPLYGMRTCIIGKGLLVGYPLSTMFFRRKAKVTILSALDKENLEQYVRNSDLIISAAGERQIVKADWINPGSIVIDAGVSRGIQGVDEKSIVGDVEFEEASKKCSIITPVPNGIGPITVAKLLKNVVLSWDDNFCSKQNLQHSE